MSVLRDVTLVGLALGFMASPVLAQKDTKKFLEEVRSIILPDEEKTFKALKDKGDREEFVRIFWVRRDPDLDTPVNEFRNEYEKVRAQADQSFRGGGRAGSESDCGRVFILLGPPDAVLVGSARSNEVQPRYVRDTQAWVYRDRPGFKFKGGQVEIPFDETCMLPQGARLGEQLSRVSEGKIQHPNIDYRKGPDGKIVKLEEQLPKPTPLMALFKSPRQDFPATFENSMFLRTPDGASYVAGLARVEAGTLTVEAAGEKKTSRVVVGAQAVTETGRVAASSEREVKGELAPDGGLIVSYGMALKPGDYTLRLGVLDPKSGKGAAIVQPLKVPDFGGEELTLSPLLVLRDVQDVAPDPQDPLAAFQLGNTRLVPRYANVFAKEDSVVLIAFVYNAKVDETTAKPSVTTAFTITRDGKPVAKAPEQTSDTSPTGPSVGPVPLSAYPPGKYVAQVKIRDNVAQKDYIGEATFEVR